MYVEGLPPAIVRPNDSQLCPTLLATEDKLPLLGGISSAVSCKTAAIYSPGYSSVVYEEKKGLFVNDIKLEIILFYFQAR